MSATAIEFEGVQKSFGLAFSLEIPQIEVLAQVPLTLEDLFLALIKSADSRSGWRPHMSAA
jgi:hypothetical protein